VSGFLGIIRATTFKWQSEVHDGEKHAFSGRRLKRGLYKSKDGFLINADVNGGYNIGKKAFPNAFVADGIEGVGLHPKIVVIR
jgi:transposase